MPDTQSDQLCINTIRTLSMDAVQAAKSGHPGIPGAGGVLFMESFLRFDPDEYERWGTGRVLIVTGSEVSLCVEATSKSKNKDVKDTCTKTAYP